MDQRGVIGISGGSVELGDLIPDGEAFGHFGPPSARAEPMASWPKGAGMTFLANDDPNAGEQEVTIVVGKRMGSS
jgi:hypothetical protein